MRQKDRRNKRQRLFAAQGGRCAYCGAVMVLDPALCLEGRYATFDHIWPRSDGGRRQVLACRACNDAKGVHPPWEFMQQVRAAGR